MFRVKNLINMLCLIRGPLARNKMSDATVAARDLRPSGNVYSLIALNNIWEHYILTAVQKMS